MLNLRRYWREVRQQNIVDQHSIANVWVTALVAVANIALVAVVSTVTVELQNQANALQRRMFVSEQNERNKERLQETLLFFAREDAQITAKEADK